MYTGTGAVWENPTRGIPVFNPMHELMWLEGRLEKLGRGGGF